MVEASSTSLHASGMVMKYRVTSGWVTVTGPPLRICSRNSGTMLPLLPSTLPKRVVMNEVLPVLPSFLMKSPKLWTYISARRFVAPMTLLGRTALSLEIMMNFFTSYFTARSARITVPPTFVCTASQGYISIIGTCLYAAAWNIMSGRNFFKTDSTLSLSRTSPRIEMKGVALCLSLISMSIK